MEMGGYLPLELNNGKSRFQSVHPDDIVAVNSGRTAIWYAVLSLSGKRIHVPYYYCPDVISMLQDMEIDVVFYHIREDFLPVRFEVQEHDIVLLVNYFGITNKSICKYALNYKKVIIDQAHGYYYEPVMQDGIMNVYSCRKFIGVADGAYLIGKELKKINLPQDVSFSRVLHLYKSIELGTNAAYLDNKENECKLAGNYLYMSTLTKRILDNADNETIILRRCENFKFLHEQLKGLQKLSITDKNIVPYMYPLLLDRDIHQTLVRQQIYVPILWKHLLDTIWNGTLEQHYAKFLIPLPFDQRYSRKEMTYLVDAIYSAVEQNHSGDSNI